MSDGVRRPQLYLDENGRQVQEGPDSSMATFSNLDPNTSEADVLGGTSERILWGTTLTQAEVQCIIKDFLLNFSKKYRMIRDGEIAENEQLPADHQANEKEYLEMMKTMLELGTQTLNLDLKNLKAYPATNKLWYQIQDYPADVISIFDSAIKDVMIDLAEKRMEEMRAEKERTPANTRARQTSSVPLPPSSEADFPARDVATAAGNAADMPDLVREVEAKVYCVRPFGLEQSINLRELSPGGMFRRLRSLKRPLIVCQIWKES